MKLRKRIRYWWRRFNQNDSAGSAYARFLTLESWHYRRDWQKRHNYVRRMSGGYPTDEKP